MSATLLAETLPANSVVLVVSKGDESLLQIPNLRCWHFPQDLMGRHANSYPADSTAAIGQLEMLRDRGAQFLMFPTAAYWWLQHYTMFREYLENHYTILHDEQQTCTIFDLRQKLD